MLVQPDKPTASDFPIVAPSATEVGVADPPAIGEDNSAIGVNGGFAPDGT